MTTHSPVPFTFQHQFAFRTDNGVAATGSVGLAGLPDDGDTFDISDGVTLLQFEFDDAATSAVGTLVLGGQPTDADTFVINDGANPAVTFEFDSNASVTETATLRRVVIGASVAATLVNLAAAVNNAPALNITAISITSGTTVNLVHDVPGTAGNVAITEPVNVSTNLSDTGMAGGTALAAASGDVAVAIGATVAATLANLAAAIDAASFTVKVASITSTAVQLVNEVAGPAGNVTVAASVNVSTDLTVSGMSGGAHPVIGVWKREPYGSGLRAPRYPLLIQNAGDAPVTIRLQSSSNNNSTGNSGLASPDPYADLAAMSFDDGLSVVSSITVVGGGFVHGFIKLPQTGDNYFKLDITNKPASAHGVVNLEYVVGSVVPRERVGVP